ncbi:hypothetical protein BDV10DRAFT_187171 [Aspergillus recurvatus]
MALLPPVVFHAVQACKKHPLFRALYIHPEKMHFATAFTVSALSVLSTAAPSAIQPRQAVNTVYLGLYSNPGCAGTTGGDVDHIHLTGSGYYNCLAATVKQSIAIAQNLSG